MSIRKSPETEQIRNPEETILLFRNTLEAISLGHLNADSVLIYLLRYITDFKKLNRSDTTSKLLGALNNYRSMIPQKIYKKLWDEIRG